MLFATTAAHAIFRRYNLYASLLLFLTFASVMWHKSTKTDDAMYLFWLDQIAIWSVVIFSLYYASRAHGIYRTISMTVCLLLLCFMSIVISAWSKNLDAQTYHSGIHVFATLGIHSILLGI